MCVEQVVVVFDLPVGDKLVRHYGTHCMALASPTLSCLMKECMVYQCLSHAECPSLSLSASLFVHCDDHFDEFTHIGNLHFAYRPCRALIT